MRFLKNSLLAAKVIMVDMASGLHDCVCEEVRLPIKDSEAPLQIREAFAICGRGRGRRASTSDTDT